jgi:hypothetical protein
MPVILALGMLSHEDSELKFNLKLGFIVRPCHNSPTHKKEREREGRKKGRKKERKEKNKKEEKVKK